MDESYFSHRPIGRNEARRGVRSGFVLSEEIDLRVTDTLWRAGTPRCRVRMAPYAAVEIHGRSQSVFDRIGLAKLFETGAKESELFRRQSREWLWIERLHGAVWAGCRY